MGSRAVYSWMSANVGLLTRRGSSTFSPSATARTRGVLPAPSGPIRATTDPGNNSPPRRRPNAVVALRSGSSSTVDVGMSAGKSPPVATGGLWDHSFLLGGDLVHPFGLPAQVPLDE